MNARKIMLSSLPANLSPMQEWAWSDIEPYYRELAGRPLDDSNVSDWLAAWTRLSEIVSETETRRYVAYSRDTTDQAAEQRYHHFLETITPPAETAEQKLKQKLLDSGLEPAGMAIPLRKMRTEARLFREANLPLLTRERKLGGEYDKIIGVQTVSWEGEEVTLLQLRPVYEKPERDLRERAWRLAAGRQLADRQAINELWVQLLQLRRQLAANANFPDYRAFRWQQRLRFDYTPADCQQFHQAIETVVVPVAQRLYEKRRQRLGLKTLRPWDLEVDPLSRPPLRPFESVAGLEQTGEAIFRRVDPQLGAYFATMRQESLLDLDNRKGKAPGGYCTSLAVSKRPFIFMNAVGVQNDIRTLLHEAGHAFHVFERAGLPYDQQRRVGAEFSEVASFSMELLASPYLAAEEGGFYAPADAVRHRIDHLEEIILFWPYMAVVDAFQHWVYTNAEAAGDPANCDATWAELWQRFMPGVDWSGLEEVMETGWHRKLHIHRIPFYYVEYGLARLGAMQVWQKALHDQAAAVARYRQALALGGTVSLPELYQAAGARFAFDAATVQAAVTLAEQTIGSLENT